MNSRSNFALLTALLIALSVSVAVFAETIFLPAYAADYELVSKWGSFGSGNGLFNNPGDISVAPSDEEFYVIDSENNRIQKFSSEGPFISKWGMEGELAGQFNEPQGISVDPSGKIVYVADTGNNRIQKFDSNGSFIGTWGSPGSANGLFNEPQGISVDPSGKIVYVADTGNNRIQKFDSNGSFIGTWGSTGSANGLFNGPIDIAVDPSGKIVYVADTGNNRIQKFDSNGNFITKWGRSGSEDGQLRKPSGIAVDPKTKEIVVVDSMSNRIQKFDSNGNFITKWGSVGSGNSQFKDAYGTAIDSNGRVYISDKENNNIQLFTTIQKIIQPYLPPPSTQTVETVEPLVSDSRGNLTISDLPDALTLTDNSGSDNFLPIRAALVNGNVIDFDTEGDFEFDNFELSDWYPAVTFQFPDGSPLGLVDVKSILIGQIKSYKSPTDILKSATSWKQIPLNEQVALPLDHKGRNFMIVEAQFESGITGIYSGSFDMDTFATKSLGLDFARDDIKEGADFKIKRDSKFKTDFSDPYWQLAQSIACKELEGHGFSEC